MSQKRTGVAYETDALRRAYVYPTQGSGALQPRPEAWPERPLPQPKAAPRPEALPKPFPLGGVLLIVLVSVLLGSVLLAQYGQITASQKRITRYESQIGDATVVSRTLQLRLAQAYSVSAVEAAAINMGMQYPDQDQLRFVALPEVPVQPPSQPQEQSQGIWQWLMERLDRW